jgi:hypothetical protein
VGQLTLLGASAEAATPAGVVLADARTILTPASGFIRKYR